MIEKNVHHCKCGKAISQKSLLVITDENGNRVCSEDCQESCHGFLGVPKAWSQWQHKNTGRIYRIMAVANTLADRHGWPVTVVYEDQDGARWARPLSEWHERYEAL